MLYTWLFTTITTRQKEQLFSLLRKKIDQIIGMFPSRQEILDAPLYYVNSLSNTSPSALIEKDVYIRYDHRTN